MATKKQVMEAALRGEGCLGKCKDDEPVFVLVGDDLFAAGTIGFWVSRLSMMAGRNRAKVDEANEVIKEFQLWAAKHGTKIPD
jgi:hypothetical protein